MLINNLETICDYNIVYTYDCFYMWPFEGGQTKVSNLDHASGTIDKYVVALQVSVDNWWRSCMQVIQPLQYLPSPATDNLGPDIFKTSQVTKKWNKHL